MRRVGLIGGISWVATSAYYERLNLEVGRRLGGNASADLVIRSLNFAEVLAHAGTPAVIEEMMAEAVRTLVGAGARIIAVGSSTDHKFLGDLKQADVSFLHIADAVRGHLRAKRIRRLGILGTKYVLNDPFLTDRINIGGQFEFLKPEGRDIDRLHTLIIEEIAQQNVGKRSLRRLADMVSSFQEAGAEAVLLGSTELWYAFREIAVDLPVIDGAEVHSRAIVESALLPGR